MRYLLKWCVIFILILAFNTADEAWEWLKDMNHRIYGDDVVRVGCTYKRISDGKICVEIFDIMQPHLLASETAAIEVATYTDFDLGLPQ